MHQPTHSVGKEHIDLLRLDDRGNFARAETRMQDRLPGAIGARLLVRCAGRSSPATR